MKVIEKNVLPVVVKILQESFSAPCELNKSFDWLSSIPTLKGKSAAATLYRELTGLAWQPKPGSRGTPLKVSAFFGPPLNMIFLFDDDTHFTQWRARSIELYPPEVAVSFDVKFYLQHCREKRVPRRLTATQVKAAKQRAFWDALADLLPAQHGLNPTLRIAQAELVDRPGQELRPRELTEQLAALIDKRLAVRAGTTFLQMLEHPSGKPWVPKLFGNSQ